MAIGSFSSRSGVIFPLLNIQDAPQATAQLDESVFVPFSMADGSFNTIGNGPLPIAYGDLTATFHINPQWLLRNGYTANLAGMESARIKWAAVVLRGGTGTITDSLPLNTKNANGIVLPGNPPLRVCTATVISHSTKPMAGALPVLEIDCVFRCQTGFWTLSDGTFQWFS